MMRSRYGRGACVYRADSCRVRALRGERCAGVHTFTCCVRGACVCRLYVGI